MGGPVPVAVHVSVTPSVSIPVRTRRGGSDALRKARGSQDRHQRVDHRVASYEDPAAIGPFAQEVELGSGRGGEQDIGEGIDGPSIHLFGKRPLEVVAA